MELIQKSLEPYVIYITSTFLIFFLGVIVMIYFSVKKKKRYHKWREKISIGIYTFEREGKEDENMIQLFEENEALKAEILILEKKYKNLNIFLILVALFYVLFGGSKSKEIK